MYLTFASPVAGSDIQSSTALIQAPEMLRAICLLGQNLGLVMTGRRLRLVTARIRSTIQEQVPFEVDMYDIQYEHVPHFCFSCGRLGHSELYCPNPGPRDAKGDLPFGPKLRASDDWKKVASGDSSNKEHYSGTSNQRESKNSTTSTKGGNIEVNSPVKNRTNYKRKDVPKQAYRRVAETKLLITDGSAAAVAEVEDHDMSRDENEAGLAIGEPR
ncbi:hypothetical protein D1007_23290 [Hordeum vulgare]|nr:hypothetical protein D1007_23290 [Hordeum vulgare]